MVLRISWNVVSRVSRKVVLRISWKALFVSRAVWVVFEGVRTGVVSGWHAVSVLLGLALQNVIRVVGDVVVCDVVAAVLTCRICTWF